MNNNIMVDFGKKIQNVKRSSSWGYAFFDYDILKNILEQYKKLKDNNDGDGENNRYLAASASSSATIPTNAATSSSSSSSSFNNNQRIKSYNSLTMTFRNVMLNDSDHNIEYQQRLIVKTTIQFLHILQKELEKVTLFYIQEKGKIATELNIIKQEFIELQQKQHGQQESQQESQQEGHTQVEEGEDNIIHIMERKYFNVSVHLLKLIQYLDMNVQGIRKILKTHDKILPKKYKLSNIYFNKNHHNKIMIPSSSSTPSFTSSLNNQHQDNNSTGLSLSNRQHNHIDEDGIVVDGRYDNNFLLNNGISIPYNDNKQIEIICNSYTIYGNQLIQSLIQEENINTLIQTLQNGLIQLNQYNYQYQSSLQIVPNDHDDIEKANQSLPPPPPATLSSSIGSSSFNHRRNLSTGCIMSFDDMDDMTSSKQQKEQQGTATVRVSQRKLVPPSTSSSSLAIHATTRDYNSIVAPNTSNNNYLKFDHPDYVMLRIRSAQRRFVLQKNNFMSLVAASFEVRYNNESKDYDDENNSIILLKDTGNAVDMSRLLRKSHHPNNINDDINDANDIQTNHNKRTKRQRISDMINLLSSFLFMMNFYIVAPTSSSYAMKLNVNASMSSMIIGMTPTAAMFSAILYSYWTNTYYKPPLIFGGVCSIIGNIIYILGLPYHSIHLVMLGRILNGFGSARSINRRYIADVFTKEQRTEAAAIFVTSGAMGMAAGPAAAAILTTFTKHNHSLYWQKENTPGTFMALLWILYTIALIFLFEDPLNKQSEAVAPAPAEEMIMSSSSKSKDLMTISQEQKQQPITSISIIPLNDVVSTDNNEMSPLLKYDEDGDGNVSLTKTCSTINSPGNSSTKNNTVDNNDIPIWKNTSACMTFFIYFVIKLCSEAVLSSTSVFTTMYFEWGGSLMGMYLAALGLLVLPANVVVAYYAPIYEDRDFIIWMNIGMVIGCLVTINYSGSTHDYSQFQYVTGSIILFVSSTALEGPTMSLLSKTIPKSWSKGFFNIGLLATEAGTFGRVVADMFLSTMGAGNGINYLLNRSYGAFTGVTSLCLLLTWYYYPQMEPLDFDD